MVPTGALSTPSFGRNGEICLTVYQNNTYNIYEYFPEYKKRTTNFTVTAKWTDPEEKTEQDSYASNFLRPYQWGLSVDNFLGGFMINSSLGVGVLGMLQLSDMLGDDRIQLLMDSSIGIYGNLLDYLNVDLSYMNMRFRHNFGFRVFHYSNYFYEFSTFQEFFNMERTYHSTYGVYGQYSYPFTTFDRVEAEIGYRGFTYATNVQFDGTNFTYGLSNSSRPALSIGYVHDSTLWDVTGPVDGIRYEFTLAKSFPIFGDSMNFEKAVFDFRSYFMLFPGYSIALRGVVGKTLDTDKDAAAFSIGGYNSVRGYDLWSFSGDTMYLVNVEIRVPFISEWSLGFPLPIRLPTVWGALFWDFGSAWNLSNPYQFCRVDNGVFHFVDLKSGLGFGFRLVLVPGIKMMVDIATPFDGTGIPSITLWRTYWFIGIDF
jgi:outer membrane protein assembly factor BamA